MRVATCISGQTRLLEEPRTTRAMFDRVVVPLKSEVFIALNVDNAQEVPPSCAYPKHPRVVQASSGGATLQYRCPRRSSFFLHREIVREHDQMGRKQACGLVLLCDEHLRTTDAVRLGRAAAIRFVHSIHNPLPTPATHVGRRILGQFAGVQCMRGVAWWTDDRITSAAAVDTTRIPP